MRNTKQALLWIIDILKENNISYRISGGFDARLYGSKRKLADIDIEVHKKDINKIYKNTKKFVIYSPKRYRDENWDLQLMTLKYKNQEIDIASFEAKIFNQATHKWVKRPGVFSDFVVKKVFGIEVFVENVKALITYKKILGRAVDRQDVNQLLSQNNSLNRVSSIIFDFDGVIEDTFEFHREKVRLFTGVKFSKKDFQDLHNGNIFSNGSPLLKDVDWIKYQKFVHQDLVKIKIKKQIKKSLEKLSKKYELFIVSSGSSKNITTYLKNNKLDHIFKDIIGIEVNRAKVDKFHFLFNKYHFSNLDCVFITDTLGDILEANKMKIPVIAVNFGYHSRSTLKKGGTCKIVSKFEDLPLVIDINSKIC